MTRTMQEGIVGGAHGALAGAIIGAAFVAILGNKAFLWMNGGPPPVVGFRVWILPFTMVLGAVLVACDRVAVARGRHLPRFLAGAGVPLAALPAISIAALQQGTLPWQGWDAEDLALYAAWLGGIGLGLGVAFLVSGLIMPGPRRAPAACRASLTAIFITVPASGFLPGGASDAWRWVVLVWIVAALFALALLITSPLARALEARLARPD